jgi:glucose/arabinose dehydrogenase
MKKASREKKYDFVQRSLRNSFVKGKQSKQTQKEIPTEREIMQTIRYNLPLRNSISRLLVRRDFVLIATAAVLAAVLAPITAHAQNNLYVSVNGNGSNSGGSIFEYTLDGMQSTFASGLARPRGLAFDGIGNFFVATTFDTPGDGFHGRILKFTPRGKLITLGNAAHNFSEGVATDSAGNVFAVAVALNQGLAFPGTIYKFAPDGTRTTFGSTPSQTIGLAFDSAGNLFAADVVHQTIYKFASSGTRTVFAGPSAFTHSQVPVGLAFDGAGNLFVSTGGNPGNDAILEFTPTGMESSFATGLNNPLGLAFDGAGNLFVAESLPNGDILEFTTGGAQLVFASGITFPEFLTFGPAR